MTTTVTAIKSTNVRNKLYRDLLKSAIVLGNRLAPKLTLRLVEHLFFRPERHDWPQEERALRDSAQKSWMYTTGMPVSEWEGLAYQVYRWGEPIQGKVVLMHGWAGRATQMHRIINALLEKGFQVIALDAPGHGASAGKSSSLIHFSNALARLLRNEGTVDAIVAHSLGGAATIHALTSANLNVGKAVLIAPSADVGAFARYMAGKLGFDLDWTSRFQSSIETRMGIPWADLHAVPRAGRLAMPGLVIHDSNDRDVALTTGQAIASAWSGASMHITHGLGHRRILKDANVIDQVVDFVVNQTPVRQVSQSQHA
jgi:pimeloyl-ACP methyl ester carboxylesterase